MERSLAEHGYWCGRLFFASEVVMLLWFVADNFAKRVKRLLLPPEIEREVLIAGPFNYAKTHHLLKHSEIWPLAERCFTELQVASVQNIFAKKLPWQFDISAEDTHIDKVVWRLVRPGYPEDVGPVHADQWFWDANEWKVPEGKRPLKLWAMIGDGDSGLSVAPGSHRKKWNFDVEHRHGKLKPIFDPKDHGVRMVPLVVPAGHGVIFDHNLLHGGLPCPPYNPCRVSIEATLLIRE